MGESRRAHYLQHVPFEGLGSIQPWLQKQGYQLTVTHLYLDQPLPPVEQFDWLIVMGGPMGVHDDRDYPWLARERAFIGQAIEAGKTVLGICLGAQLIARVLGAKVTANPYPEIGWFGIDVVPAAQATPVGELLAGSAEVFHWHGDTFEIPEGAVPLASSVACRHQGFVFNDRVIGLQFHLETTLASAKALIDNCHNELDGSRFVQTAQAMLADVDRFQRINHKMDALLHYLAAKTV